MVNISHILSIFVKDNFQKKYFGISTPFSKLWLQKRDTTQKLILKLVFLYSTQLKKKKKKHLAELSSSKKRFSIT